MGPTTKKNLLRKKLHSSTYRIGVVILHRCKNLEKRLAAARNIKFYVYISLPPLKNFLQAEKNF